MEAVLSTRVREGSPASWSRRSKDADVARDAVATGGAPLGVGDESSVGRWRGLGVRRESARDLVQPTGFESFIQLIDGVTLCGRVDERVHAGHGGEVCKLVARRREQRPVKYPALDRDDGRSVRMMGIGERRRLLSGSHTPNVLRRASRGRRSTHDYGLGGSVNLVVGVQLDVFAIRREDGRSRATRQPTELAALHRRRPGGSPLRASTTVRPSETTPVSAGERSNHSSVSSSITVEFAPGSSEYGSPVLTARRGEASAQSAWSPFSRKRFRPLGSTSRIPKSCSASVVHRRTTLTAAVAALAEAGRRPAPPGRYWQRARSLARATEKLDERTPTAGQRDGELTSAPPARAVGGRAFGQLAQPASGTA